MICKKCGNEIQENDEFCENCGTKVKTNEPIKIKLNHFLIGVLGFVVILFIVTFGTTIYNNNQKPIENPTNYDKTNNQIQDNITIGKETTKNITEKYTNFKGNIEELKNVFDTYWEGMQKSYNDIDLQYSEWKNYKNIQGYNLAIKSFYVYPNKDFAMLSLVHDNKGNVISLQFRGINLNVLEAQYNQNQIQNYFLVMFSIPQLLYYETNDDEELKKYLQQEIISAYDKNAFYLNEYKKGIKFSMGATEEGYLGLETCLEQYVQK